MSSSSAWVQVGTVASIFGSLSALSSLCFMLLFLSSFLRHGRPVAQASSTQARKIESLKFSFMLLLVFLACSDLLVGWAWAMSLAVSGNGPDSVACLWQARLLAYAPMCSGFWSAILATELLWWAYYYQKEFDGRFAQTRYYYYHVAWIPGILVCVILELQQADTVYQTSWCWYDEEVHNANSVYTLYVPRALCFVYIATVFGLVLYQSGQLAARRKVRLEAMEPGTTNTQPESTLISDKKLDGGRKQLSRGALRVGTAPVDDAGARSSHRWTSGQTSQQASRGRLTPPDFETGTGGYVGQRDRASGGRGLRGDSSALAPPATAMGHATTATATTSSSHATAAGHDPPCCHCACPARLLAMAVYPGAYLLTVTGPFLLRLASISDPKSTTRSDTRTGIVVTEDFSDGLLPYGYLCAVLAPLQGLLIFAMVMTVNGQLRREARFWGESIFPCCCDRLVYDGGDDMYDGAGSSQRIGLLADGMGQRDDGVREGAPHAARDISRSRSGPGSGPGGWGRAASGAVASSEAVHAASTGGLLSSWPQHQTGDQVLPDSTDGWGPGQRGHGEGRPGQEERQEGGRGAGRSDSVHSHGLDSLASSAQGGTFPGLATFKSPPRVVRVPPGERAGGLQGDSPIQMDVRSGANPGQQGGGKSRSRLRAAGATTDVTDRFVESAGTAASGVAADKAAGDGGGAEPRPLDLGPELAAAYGMPAGAARARNVMSMGGDSNSESEGTSGLHGLSGSQYAGGTPMFARASGDWKHAVQSIPGGGHARRPYATTEDEIVFGLEASGSGEHGHSHSGSSPSHTQSHSQSQSQQLGGLALGESVRQGGDDLRRMVMHGSMHIPGGMAGGGAGSLQRGGGDGAGDMDGGGRAELAGGLDGGVGHRLLREASRMSSRGGGWGEDDGASEEDDMGL